ncbi:DUF4291 family protein [Streptomyces sp. MAR4 CNX-425]|uniref:DUF4291 family protein n=1 Tax=Streptomyces sp. MAR4 CNX-425 TaxID=3406343 RepID=UPI003B4FFB65
MDEVPLRHSCLSHHGHRMSATHGDWPAAKEAGPVRIRWDPERDLALRPLERRAIQIGLSGPAAGGYVDEWIRGIEVREKRRDEAAALLPPEEPYALPEDVRARIGAA